MKKLTKGFTLIELLVVIAIIGILSSVVLASLNTARQKARDARRISDLKNIQLALELYADSNQGSYPTSSINVLVPTYLQSLPTPPPGSGQSAYAYAGTGPNCVGYHIGAVLEDENNAVLPGVNANSIATACTGSTGFNGNSSDCLDPGAAGTACYDLTN